jgi:hypothetical protein
MFCVVLMYEQKWQLEAVHKSDGIEEFLGIWLE